ncbi:hypothetical protein DPEC_G00115210 [Dallia pectoralis]|uniref:Uncharacterized protein n=1 Tax=Dallia pectoralis TaxID=75939 RepID=A0ACC2GTW4_DALPE|nr:hypothetical protein DPEC_G00115210 [Dallia pectoralis]
MLVQKELEELQSMKQAILCQQEEERQAHLMMQKETYAQQQQQLEQIQRLQEQLRAQLEEQSAGRCTRWMCLLGQGQQEAIILGPGGTELAHQIMEAGVRQAAGTVSWIRPTPPGGRSGARRRRAWTVVCRRMTRTRKSGSQLGPGGAGLARQRGGGRTDLRYVLSRLTLRSPYRQTRRECTDRRKDGALRFGKSTQRGQRRPTPLDMEHTDHLQS